MGYKARKGINGLLIHTCVHPAHLKLLLHHLPVQ
jgi:hypothetical protein